LLQKTHFVNFSWIQKPKKKKEKKKEKKKRGYNCCKCLFGFTDEPEATTGGCAAKSNPVTLC